MADFSDLIFASALGSWFGNPNALRDLDDEAARTRAKNIQDNFGIRPASLDEFYRRNGGRGLLKGLGIGAVITAIGGAFALIPILTVYMVPIIAVAATIGLVAAAITSSIHCARVRNGYNTYLDAVAAIGREGRDKTIAVEKVAEPATKAPAKSFADQVAASREQIPAPGKVR